MRIVFSLGLLPLILSFTRIFYGQVVIMVGFIIFVLAQFWAIKRRHKLITILSMTGGALFSQGVVAFTGFYSSPFLFMFLIPPLTYGATEGTRWGYYSVLVYTPFMLFLTGRASIHQEWSWAAYIVVIWILLFLIANTIREFDIDNKRALLMLQDKVKRDPLTGVFNRYKLEDLYQSIKRIYQGSLCTVVMLDLDGFKKHNDQRGHLVGDEILRKVSTVLLENLRDEDTVIRYGGDEFLLVLWDLGEEEAHHVVQRIQYKVEEITGCSISGGQATGIVRNRYDFEEMVKGADKALFIIKEQQKVNKL